MPAEHLMAGDRIITRTCGSTRLSDLQVISHAGPMVRFSPDTLGRARPESFVMLPPDQRVLLRSATGASRDGLFSARELVDGDTIKWHQPKQAVRLVRLVFDATQIVYAGGLELEITA